MISALPGTLAVTQTMTLFFPRGATEFATTQNVLAREHVRN